MLSDSRALNPEGCRQDKDLPGFPDAQAQRWADYQRRVGMDRTLCRTPENSSGKGKKRSMEGP